jgi:hypothetical protein
MAVAVEELSPAVAGEYERIVGAGGARGKPSLDRAKSAVANRGQSAAPPRPPSSGRPGPHLRVGVDQLGQLWAGGRKASRLLPSAVSGRSSILPRLITAGFLGILVLEVASSITGHYFNYSLATPLKPTGDQTYRGLFQGQVVGQSNPHMNPTVTPAAAGPPSSAKAGKPATIPGFMP